jgi:hypothetical protein
MDQLQSNVITILNTLHYYHHDLKRDVTFEDLLFALVESTSDKNDEVKQRSKQSILTIARKKKHQNVLDVIYEFLTRADKKPNAVSLK